MDFLSKGSDGDVYTYQKNKIIKFLNLNKVNYLEFYILLHLKSPFLMNALKILVDDKSIKIIQKRAQYDFSHLLLNDYKSVKFDIRMNFIRQLVNSVYVLNSYNLVHGDIKPNNILVFDENIKLNDFGLSRDCKFSKSKRKLYTINYRPPECNSNNYHLKSDIWALGCTIYEIYYGKKYFLLDNRGNQYHIACQEERKRENSFINKLIKDMIKEDISERISIEEVAKFFNITKIFPKKNLFLKEDFFFESFINHVYFQENKCDKNLEIKALNNNFEIFNIF